MAVFDIDRSLKKTAPHQLPPDVGEPNFTFVVRQTAYGPKAPALLHRLTLMQRTQEQSRDFQPSHPILSLLVAFRFQWKCAVGCMSNFKLYLASLCPITATWNQSAELVINWPLSLMQLSKTGWSGAPSACYNVAC
jgi:hypothetical protein